MTGLVLWNALRKARSSMYAPGIFIQSGHQDRPYQGCYDLIKNGNFGWKLSKRSGMILSSKTVQLTLVWFHRIHQLIASAAMLHISYFARKYQQRHQLASCLRFTVVQVALQFSNLHRFCQTQCPQAMSLEVLLHGDNVPTDNAKSR